MNAHVAELRPDRNELDAALAGARAGIDRGTLQPIQLVGIAERLGTAGRVADAVVLYQHWLARRSSPLDHVVHFNLGVSLSVLGQLAPAETAYRAALAIDPSFAQAWFNLGSVLERLGRP